MEARPCRQSFGASWLALRSAQSARRSRARPPSVGPWSGSRVLEEGGMPDDLSAPSPSHSAEKLNREARRRSSSGSRIVLLPASFPSHSGRQWTCKCGFRARGVPGQTWEPRGAPSPENRGARPYARASRGQESFLRPRPHFGERAPGHSGASARDSHPLPAAVGWFIPQPPFPGRPSRPRRPADMAHRPRRYAGPPRGSSPNSQPHGTAQVHVDPPPVRGRRCLGLRGLSQLRARKGLRKKRTGASRFRSFRQVPARQDQAAAGLAPAEP